MKCDGPCEKLEQTETQIALLATELSEVRKLVEVTARNTAEIVEFWTSLQGGIKVLGWLGTAAKFIASFAAAVSIVWGTYVYLFKGGPKP